MESNGSVVRDWVISKLDELRFTDEVNRLYDNFKEETGSTAKESSFRKEVSRTFRRYNNAERGWKRGSPYSGNRGAPVYTTLYDSDKPEFEFVEMDGSTAYASGKSSRVYTVEELLRVCEVDLDVWEVVSASIKKQEIGTKDKEGHLSWDEGKMTGELKYGKEPVVVPMIHIQVSLRKKVLTDPKFDLPSPVVVKSPSVPSIDREVKSTGMKAALILSDAQISFYRDGMGKLHPVHDRKVMVAAIHVAQILQPNIIIYNGDFFDLPDWSDKFISSPEMKNTLQPSLFEFVFFHELMRLSSPSSKFVYIEGNHDARLEKALIHNLSAAYGLYRVGDKFKTPVLSLRNLVSHKENGIEFSDPYPQGHYWLNDFLRVGHGEIVRSKSGHTVNAVVQDSTYSQVFGHIHRIEIATKTVHNRDGCSTIHAASFGTMARIDDGVVPSNRARHNWQQGFGVEYYDDKNSYPTPVQVMDSVVVFNGERSQIYEEGVQNYVRELSRFSGIEF